jgi:hypothetical protein
VRPLEKANSTYGPPELCAWQVVPGVFWIQTTDPQFSRKLEKCEDARAASKSLALTFSAGRSKSAALGVRFEGSLTAI